MVQHILIRLDEETNRAFITPEDGNLWTDDQELMWSIIDPRLEWDNDNFPNAAVTFSSGWEGTTPRPVPSDPPPDGHDRRSYVATGPGPASPLPPGAGVATFTYKVWVRPVNTTLSFAVKKRGGEMIDPDISNQPHPP